GLVCLGRTFDDLIAVDIRLVQWGRRSEAAVNQKSGRTEEHNMRERSDNRMGEVDELRARVQRLEHRLAERKRGVTLTAAGVAGGCIALWGSKAFSDPSTPTACGHSELYCFQPNAPAVAAQVNSNFETVAKGVDAKFDKTGGTVSGNVTVTGTVTEDR